MTSVDRIAPVAGPGFEPGDATELLAELAAALERVGNGDFKARLQRRTGLAGQVAERFDEEPFEGAWAEGVRAVNALIDDLGRPTTEIARVIVAVAEGDLSQQMALEIDGRPLRGEFLRIGRTVNTMVGQLSSFADEVTRVAREVGSEGKLG